MLKRSFRYYGDKIFVDVLTLTVSCWSYLLTIKLTDLVVSLLLAIVDKKKD